MFEHELCFLYPQTPAHIEHHSLVHAIVFNIGHLWAMISQPKSFDFTIDHLQANIYQHRP